MGTLPWREFLSKSPLSGDLKREIARLYTERKDYLPGLSREEKIARLSKISYATFLTEVCKANPAVLPILSKLYQRFVGSRIEAISAMACFRNPDDYGAYQYAGFEGMGLSEKEEKERRAVYFFIFRMAMLLSLACWYAR